MSLNVTVLAASMGHGISSKSGAPKPYSFAYVEYLVPCESYIQGDHNIQKHGSQVKQIDMSNNQALFDKFKAVELPKSLQLEMSADPANPSRNIVTGIK
jgi:hypothetical protein